MKEKIINERIMNEEYVSYEIAKQLKEKKYDFLCRAFYDSDKVLHISQEHISNDELQDLAIACPRYAPVLKWFKEHDIKIELLFFPLISDRGEYGYIVSSLITESPTDKHSDGFITDCKTNLDNAIKTALTMI